MIKLGAIADSFSGATSFGMSLTKEGARTAVIFRAASVIEEKALCNFDAVAVSVNTESSSKDEALYNYRTAAKILKDSGVHQLSFKLGRTYQWDIAAKIDAILNVLGDDSVAIVVLPECHKKKTEWAPEQNAGVVRIMCKEPDKKQIKDALIKARNNKSRVLILDVTEEEMEKAAEAVSELDWNVLFADSGVFSAKVAHRKGWFPNTAPISKEAAVPKEVGTALVLDGSASPATQRQMEVLFSHNDVDHIAVNTGLLTKSDENAEYEIKRITDSVSEAIQSNRPPRTMVVDTVLCGKILDLPAEDHKNQFQNGTCASNIKNSVARIATQIIQGTAEKLIGIYMTGDETITAVCGHLGVNAIELSNSILPQAAAGHLIGTGKELPIIWNKGGIGNEYTAEDLVNHLFLTASKGRPA